MFSFFKKKNRKETDEEKIDRVLSLCKEGDYGLCPPPMNAQVAMNELSRYLLGEDWYIVMPVSGEQANTEMVLAIERKYEQCKRGK